MLGFLIHLPSKPRNPGDLKPKPLQLPSEVGPKRHLVVSDSRQVRAHGSGGVDISNCRFLVTALMSTSLYSLQGSFTSFSYIQLQGKKEGREGKAHKGREYKNREQLTDICYRTKKKKTKK